MLEGQQREPRVDTPGGEKESGGVKKVSLDQLKMLEQFGRVKLQDLKKFDKYIPEGPDIPVFKWVLNISGNLLIVGDLIVGQGDRAKPFDIGSDELVYLPRFFSADKINSSPGLRDFVIDGKLMVIEDPTKVKIKPVVKPIDTLPAGEMKAEAILGKNPFIESLKRVRKKEKEYNASLIPEGD